MRSQLWVASDCLAESHLITGIFFLWWVFITEPQKGTLRLLKIICHYGRAFTADSWGVQISASKQLTVHSGGVRALLSEDGSAWYSEVFNV